MRQGKTYQLADATIIEPLVNRWPAWPYVIAPVAASLHLLNYQLELMRSYLQDPVAHVKAAHDPELIGGAFMSIPVERADEVERLLAETMSRQRQNIELARAVTGFCSWLDEEAKGQSLEKYYEVLPEQLRGYVELAYDYMNHPIVRFIEGLLYESPYYDKSLQVLKLSRARRDDARPFFMSTPALPTGAQLEWAIPFEHPHLDEFCRLDITPQPLARIRELVGLSEKDDSLLLPLLTEAPLAPKPKRESAPIRLRYFGHACVLVEYQGISLLTDPFIAAVPVEGGMARLTFRDLPDRIDYVLITHSHCDHFVLETLLRLRDRINCLIVPKSYGLLYGDVSLKLLARKLGFKHVLELDTFETIALADGEILAVPFLGEHGDLAHGKTGYVVRVGNERILFAADSNCLDRRMYEQVRNYVGQIETVFLGIEPTGAPLSWSYGPLFPKKPPASIDRSRRQRGADAGSALELLAAVGATRIYNYGMGREPWLQHILALDLAANSPQIQEADKLLATARAQGFLAAERPLGKAEIQLSNAPNRTGVLDAAPPAQLNAQPGALAGALPDDWPELSDANDQFAF